jgi:hypothetical protein
MKKRAIHFDAPIVTDQKSAEVAEPRESSLDLPASSVSPQFPAVLQNGFGAVGPVWADQVDTPLFQAIPQRIRVGGLVVNQSRRFATGSPTAISRDGHTTQRFLDERDFVGGGRVQELSKRNTLAVDHHHPLRTLAAFGFSDALAPFFAGAKEPSAKVSCQSSLPAASSSPRKLRQIVSHKSSSSQSRRRRQQVLEEGKSFGKSFHLAPLRSTQRIPSKHARLSAGGRPPRRERLGSGRNGRIFSHCESVSSLLVMANPFARQVNHKTMRRANLAMTRF